MMSPSKLTQTLLGTLLDSPIAVEFGSQALEKVKAHFTFTSDEITKAYQNSCGYAFVAISVGLDTASIFQTVRYSNVTREFANKIEQDYLQAFAKQNGVHGAALSDFKTQAIKSLRYFSKNTDKLFEITALTEEDLAAFIGQKDTPAITEVILEQMQHIMPVDDSLAAFLRYDEQLGNAVIFFFRELIRQDQRLRDTQVALQQDGLCVDVQNLQAKLNLLEKNIITAIKDNSPTVEFAQQIDHLKSVQIRHDQLLSFESHFQSRANEILAWAQAVYTSLEQIERDVEETKKTTAETQAVVKENNAILQALYQLMTQRGLSSQVNPRDEFSLYDNESQQLIEAAVLELNKLPTQNPEYSQISIKVGSVLSSMGNLESAAALFIQAIKKAKNNEDKALANFNLFQVRWRQAFAEISLSNKEQHYDNALSALQTAIELSNGHYALHDIHKGYYPIKKLLGAGGMGCAFLCENHNYLIKEHQLVVVKCFWENITGSLDTVFKEPFAMAKIAGNLVPEPLDYGYADNTNKKGPYFVTEYFEGAIDGETWLKKYGPLDLKTGLLVGLQIAAGLQRAHEAGIYHLDLKPANLLLKQTDDGIVIKIIDFGLSRVTTSLRELAQQRSQSGLSVFGQAMFGTLEYAPPEQCGYAQHFGKPSAKSDIFGFGKTMYRLLTGEIPLAVEQEPLEHAPKWYQLLSDCVRQNPEKRPESAQVLINRLKDIKKEPLRKQEDTRHKAKLKQKRQTDTGSQVKVTIIGLVMLGLGIILQFFVAKFSEPVWGYNNGQQIFEAIIVVSLLGSILLVGKYFWRHRQIMHHLAMTFGLIGIGVAIFFISVVIFDFLNISFFGRRSGEIGGNVGLSLSILLIGQYLWRHRKTMSHLAMTFGLIGIGAAIWLIPAAIFDILDIRFLGYTDEESDLIVGLFLSILLVWQYLWRHRKTKPHLAMTFGLIGIGAAISPISMIIFDSLNRSFLNFRDYESGAIVGLSLSILLIGQYLWRHRQTMPYLAMTFGLIGIGVAIWFIFIAID